MATQYTARLTQGQVLTADIMNQIGAAWESYTPALTASVTNPTLGTGSTTQGAYCRINKLVVAVAYFAFGTSGTAAGSGDYYVSLPITSVASSALNRGQAWLYDASAATGWGATLQISTTSTVIMYKATGDATIQIGAANPFAWAANDQIRVQVIYEAA